mmetsp:Transcript_32642/g.73151  ORF Transcript_32642/g.73151 Transcript_32642/m.73151 type:complete len:354 (-) Transcript_32642:73-1134(-)
MLTEDDGPREERRRPLAPMEMILPRGKRVFEVWPLLEGRNRFFCRGLCITGPKEDVRFNMCTWLCILVPSVFYFVFCARDIAASIHWLLPASTALLFVVTLVLLLLTSCTDPGVLPRRHVQQMLGIEGDIQASIGYECPRAQPGEPAPVLSPEQRKLGYKWCETCLVVRPPRATHCADCNSCVLRYDHHCPFVGNCVGQRNYHFFSAFLGSVSCLGFVVVGEIAFWMMSDFTNSSDSHGHHSEGDNLWVLVAAAVIGVPSGILGVVVLGFFLYHFCLALQGRTTKEAWTGKITVEGPTLFGARGPKLTPWRARIPLDAPVVTYVSTAASQASMVVDSELDPSSVPGDDPVRVV